jgi:hypothetical protein
MVELHPKICNICGGVVEYISNAKIYGKKYGSGYCYHCTKCGAYVGTHKTRPKEAFGILANKEMRKMKMKCHHIFDALWKTPKERKRLYKRLADRMNIRVKDCHFGYFDMEQLKRAYAIITSKGE